MKYALYLSVIAACVLLVGIVFSSFTHHDIVAHAAAVLPHVHPLAAVLFGAPMARPAHRRGIVMVRNEAGDVQSLLKSIQSAFDTFKIENNARLDAIEKGKPDVLNEEKVNRINAELSDLSQKLAALTLNGGGEGRNALSNEAAAHQKAFSSYFRRGAEAGLRELEVKAALTSSADPEGGYAVSIDVEKTIDRVLTKVSAMRGLASVIQTTAATYRKPINKGGTTTGWVGQTGARSQTTAASLAAIDFEPKELYAEPAITQTLLDDAGLDIGQWLSDEVALVFAEQEGTSFITGDGAAQPFGLLSYKTVADASWAWGKLGFVAMGTGGAFKTDGTAFDDVIDLQTSLKQGYRPGASWLMNRKTEAAVRKIKDPEGHYLWQPALQQGTIATLSGHPIAIDDNMQDIAAGNYPIAFGDFRRGYLIVDRIGIRVIRDNITVKGYVLFYTTKRVGGGVQNFEAIKLAKIS
jgi:HK97 family phage major capsid protein